MSERNPSGEPDDLDAIFTMMVSGLQEERRDPQVTALFDSAVMVEVELNKLDEPSDDMILDTLAALNDDLDQCGVLKAAAEVSGRLRPLVAEAVDDDDILALLSPTLSDLGPLLRDARGPYFQVSARNLICGAYDIKSAPITGFDGTQKTQHELVLNFNHGPDEDVTSGELYAYLDDIDLLIPEEPSALKVYDLINDKYPQIAEQLERLPANSKKDRKIIQALADFQLEIDWSHYPRHEEDERQQVLEYIEAYITNRVQLDNNLYAFSVHSALSAVDEQNQEFVIDLDEEADITATVEQIRLMPVRTETGTESYAIKIEVLASASERHSGSHTLYIPAAHISGFRNLRNKNLFKGKPKPAVTEKTYIEDTILPLSHGTDVDTATAVAATPPVEVREVSIEELNKGNDVERNLEQIHNLYKKLFEQCDVITANMFATYEEASEAREELDEVFTDFFAVLPENRVVVEAAGPGIYRLDATWDTDNIIVDSEAGTTTVRFDNTTPITGDPLAIKKGIYTGRCISAIAQGEDDGKYAVRAFMVFYEPKDEEPIRFGVPDMNIALFTMSPSREFFIDVNSKGTSVTIPEYDRIQSCRQAIGRLADQFPDLAGLPAQLSTLQDTFINADRSSFRPFENIDLLNEIGLRVGGDEEATAKTVDVLHDIFADHGVHVNGAMYDAEGKLQHEGYAGGIVKFVISTVNTIPVSEPMLVVEDEGDIHYVPLSTITSMRY